MRPVLLLPSDIQERLTPEELKAILAHELCHVRRRDNLGAALHMIAESVFWFYPLVSWIGKRLIEERERACDEEVLQTTLDPELYAQGILNVCKLYLESSGICAAGVTGSDLKRRVESIMRDRVAVNLNRGKKALLVGAGIGSILLPLGIGFLKAPLSIGQSQTAAGMHFEAASIKPSQTGMSGITLAVHPGGRLEVVNNPISNVIRNAYSSIRPFVLQGGPEWIDSDRYDIEAKAEGNPTDAEMMVMLQALLADRFKLKVHRETRELPVYALTVAKGGSKLTKYTEGSCITFDPDSPPPPLHPGEKPRDHCGNNLIARGRWDASKIDMVKVAGALSVLVRRKVIDKTGLTGLFDIHIEIPPDPLAVNDSGAPSIFTVLQDELGLKLDSDKGPVEVLVIDHIERPSGN